MGSKVTRRKHKELVSRNTYEFGYSIVNRLEVIELRSCLQETYPRHARMLVCCLNALTLLNMRNIASEDVLNELMNDYFVTFLSMFHNYKMFYSIVLMAVVDVAYRFLIVDVGANGRSCDAGIFGNSEMSTTLENGTLGIPEDRPLPGRVKNNGDICHHRG